MSGKDYIADGGSSLLKKAPDQEKTSLLQNETRESSYPKSVFFIIGNEFCERFSFYGLRAILIIYLTSRLKFTDNHATAIFHTFVFLSYFAPLFGAIVADGYLGKYRTILYMSIVYMCGNILLTFTAFPPPEAAGPLIALSVIAIGTGGIKPCVSAFGADQFAVGQEKQRNHYFSLFYFTVNLGSFLSAVFTPFLREHVQCFGAGCYPLAFGVPSILMAVSIGLLIVGKKLYVIHPASGSVVQETIYCIASAQRNRLKATDKTKKHWLDYADSRFDPAFRSEVRSLLHVLWMFVPLPMFYALFDQQGSSWTLQCTKLNLQLSDRYYILPDQVQCLNSFLILLFIPVFEFLIYPFVEKFIQSRPLRRMVVGMVLAASSFFAAGILQLVIEYSPGAVTLPATRSLVRIVNISPCPVTVVAPWGKFIVGSTQMTEAIEINPADNHTLHMTSSCAEYRDIARLSLAVVVQPAKAYMTVVADQRRQLAAKLIEYPLQKSKSGGSMVGVLSVGDHTTSDKLVLGFRNENHNINTFAISDFGISEFSDVRPGSFTLAVSVNERPDVELNRTVTCGSGAVHLVVVHTRSKQPEAVDFVLVAPNTVSVFYQIPQYVLLTVGEILFCITGLTFAYSQAPGSMKSVVLAGWLLTTAFGNLIDIIVSATHVMSPLIEFFFYASLMTVTTVVFIVMTQFYKYVDNNENSSAGDSSKVTDSRQPLMMD